MILTRGIGIGGPLVTAGLGLWFGLGLAPEQVSSPIRNFSLREWRKWHRPEDEERLKRLKVPRGTAEVIAVVAERQVQDLHLDEVQRYEELKGELLLKGLAFETRYLELLNQEREQLITEEIGRLLRQKLDNEAILVLLLLAAST